MLSIIVAQALTTSTFQSKPLLSAWVVGYNPISIKRFEEQAKILRRVFTEYYTIDKNGQPVRRERYNDFYKAARKIAQKNKTQFYVMINNYGADPGEPEIGFDPVRVAKTLATDASRKQTAAKLAAMVVEDQADGIDLDIESLKAEEKDRFSAWVVALSKELKKHSKKLSVTVHPKTDAVGNWDGPKAQDYEALSKVADVFNIMTYDFSWSGSEKPGPISPNHWVEDVVKYTKSAVSHDKIGLGVACYGYDWKVKPANSLVWEDVKNLGLKPHSDSGELADESVRFGGADNFAAKQKIAKIHKLGSLAFWYCGSEDPKIWEIFPRL